MDLFTVRDGAFVASTALVIGDVTLSPGASIWFGAVVRGDDAGIRIGAHTNVQDLSMLHSEPGADLVIGSYVTIGHQATVHCKRIGDRALIGMGAILLADVEVGEGCIVGAGALVTEGKKLPPRTKWVGVPARQVGEVTEEDIAHLEHHAAAYEKRALIYSQGRIPNPSEVGR